MPCVKCVIHNGPKLPFAWWRPFNIIMQCCATALKTSNTVQVNSVGCVSKICLISIIFLYNIGVVRFQIPICFIVIETIFAYHLIISIDAGAGTHGQLLVFHIKIIWDIYLYCYIRFHLIHNHQTKSSKYQLWLRFDSFLDVAENNMCIAFYFVSNSPTLQDHGRLTAKHIDHID